MTDPCITVAQLGGSVRVIEPTIAAVVAIAAVVTAAATVARLHGDTAFRADLDAARAELAAGRAKGAHPASDCTAEAASLSMN